jgi:hypothetical protein
LLSTLQVRGDGGKKTRKQKRRGRENKGGEGDREAVKKEQEYLFYF